MSHNKLNRNNFMVQGSILAFSSILVRLIGIIYRIPMVNTIGEEGSGYYSMAFNIYNIALILSSYSLPMAVSKLVAAHNVKKEYRNSLRVLLSAMFFAIIAGLIFATALYLGADFIAVKIYNMEYVAYPLRVLAPTIFVFAVMGVLRGFFQGKSTMLPTAISQVLEQIVNAIVSVAAAVYFVKMHDASPKVAAYGAAGGTLGTLSGAIAGFGFLSIVFIMYLPTIKRQLSRDNSGQLNGYRTVYGLLFITVIPVIFSNFIYQFSGILDDIIFSRLLVGKGMAESVRSEIIGVYSTKYKLLTNLPIAVSSAMAASLIPSIVTSKTLGNLSDVKNKVGVAVKFNMIIAIPAAVGMSVLGGPIMQMFFPGSSELAGKLLLYGSIAVVFYALSTITNAVLQAINRLTYPAINALVSLVLHIIILVCLLQFTELNAYALMIGNITFPLVICILNWFQIARSLHYHQEVIKTFLIPTISASIMGIVAIVAYKGLYYLLSSNTISVILSIGFAAAIYFILLIAMKGIGVNEIARLPKGNLIVKIFSRLHLL